MGHYEETWSYPAVDAARDGRGIHKFRRLNPGAAQTVHHGDTEYGMATSERVLITGLLVGVRTASGWGLFDIGYVDAAGAYHRLSSQYYVENRANPVSERMSYNVKFDPPLLASWKAGARSVNIRTDTDADATQCEIGWEGWREPE